MIRGNFRRGKDECWNSRGRMHGDAVMKEKCTALIRFTGASARNKEQELTNYPPSTVHGCLFRVSVPLT